MFQLRLSTMLALSFVGRLELLVSDRNRTSNSIYHLDKHVLSIPFPGII